MTASRTKILSVRLPEVQLRRIKSLAARRGATLQAVVREALGAWEGAQGTAGRFDEAIWAFQGMAGSLPNGPPATELKRRERAFEAAREARRDANLARR